MYVGLPHIFCRTDSDYCAEDGDVQFRLTYEGELKSNGPPDHKHRIRRVFHAQLRSLWDTHPYLKQATAIREISLGSFAQVHPSLKEYLANQWARLDHYNFVPLVTEELSLVCGLDILFLRPSMPGEIMKSGDIDGRLKTLFDSLRMPDTKGELGGYELPLPGEQPFFVLLQDDKLISHLSITTDTLLQPTGARAAVNDARLVISVTIRAPHRNESA